MNNTIAIISSVRTPAGLMNGTIKSLTEQELAAKAMLETVERAGISPKDLDEIVLGVSKQTSKPSNCARHAALLAGFPVDLSAYTVQRQSASGLQAVYNAYLNLRCNSAKLIMAGGCESTSHIPIEIHDARYSFHTGTRIFFDTAAAHETGAQPRKLYGELNRTVVAERIAIRHNIAHKTLWDYTMASLEKARSSDFMPAVSLEVNERKKTMVVSADQLADKPNSMSPLADGAAIHLLAAKPLEDGSAISAKILGIKAVAGTPDRLEETVYHALADLLHQYGLTVDQLDCIELCEPFAACSVAVLNLLIQAGANPKHLERIVNPHGGMLAYGNTWGASGSILLDRLIHGLRNMGGGYGAVAAFAEGGQAMALLLRVDV